MNIQAISPALPKRVMPGACTSCKGDVDTTNGFADLDGQFGAYLCFRCGRLSLPRSSMAEALIGAEQERQRALGRPFIDLNND